MMFRDDGDLGSWQTLVLLLLVFVVIVGALFVFGRGSWKTRIGNSLERLTGIPGWAAATIGVGLFGLLVAGQGFYSDVAWHIALGRDEELFTAPHTAIVLGLLLIALAGFVGIAFATWQRAEVGFRLGALRVPWSTLPLIALGTAAVTGFALDELWHENYGIDVTMWSPTHMLMIVGASLSGLASWLVLGEARVSPRANAWTRGVHLVAAWLALQGLAASQGEFSFGVPQFQQMYLPVLVTLAGAFAFVAARLVLGPWWALSVAAINFLIQGGGGESGVVSTRTGGIYVVTALVVELIAWLWGVERRLRFAVLAGVGAGTIGLAAEFAWNQNARQPWNASLLPEAVILAVLVGVGAAVVAARFATAIRGDDHRTPNVAVALGGLAVLIALVVPFPRTVGDVTAELTLDHVAPDQVVARVTLDPPDAAADARWFQTISWQGGSLVLAEMNRVGPGEYLADRPVPVGGNAKAMVRLHRGSEMMAIPVRLPLDREIGAPEIPAEDRTISFGSEKQYLMREAHDGPQWFAAVTYGYLSVIVLLWIGAFAVAVVKLSRRGERIDVLAG